MDFFDLTDRRYEYRRKEERKNTTARHSSRSNWIAIFRAWIRTLQVLRYPGIGSLSEYEPILKIFAIYSLIFSRAEYMYAAVIKEEILILRTFVKKTQQTPHHELELAQKRLKEWIHAQNR